MSFVTLLFEMKCPFLCLFWKGRKVKRKREKTVEAHIGGGGVVVVVVVVEVSLATHFMARLGMCNGGQCNMGES